VTVKNRKIGHLGDPLGLWLREWKKKNNWMEPLETKRQ